MVTLNAIIVVALFAAGYLWFTLRKTARQQLDIYDLIMLSTVAIIPLIFVLFPGFVIYLAAVAGVTFPFLLLFGVLLAILFIFVHRLTIKLHALENDNRALIQELSILKERVRIKM